MSIDLRALIRSGRTLVSDGATGTLLQQLGLPPGTCPEVWNIENPEAVRAIPARYVEAGSDIVQTNTFGANRERLKLAGLGDKTDALNAAGVRLAREAAGERAAVVASVGPTGRGVRPKGELEFQAAVAVYAEQALGLAGAEPDGIILETFTDLDDIRAAVAAIQSNTNLPLLATLSFHPGGLDPAGGIPAAVAKTLVDLGVDAVGANCGSGPRACVPVMAAMRAAVAAPLVAQPSAGLPRLVAGRYVYAVTPEAWAGFALQFRRMGVNIIGGCCGTTPEHIREVVSGEW